MEIKREHIIQQEPISGMVLYWDGNTNSLCLKHGPEDISIPYTAKRLVFIIKAFDDMSQQITQAVTEFTQKIPFIKEAE